MPRRRHTVLPSMRARRGGRIVLISSGAAPVGRVRLRLLRSVQVCCARACRIAPRRVATRQYWRLGRLSAGDRNADARGGQQDDATRNQLMCSLAKAWTADAVADCILRGIERGTFAITPGRTLTLMHRFPDIAIPLLRRYCDRLADSVRTSAPQSAQFPVTTRGNPPMKFLSSAEHGFMSF
jgi:3-dehydrosphinganine reductase